MLLAAGGLIDDHTAAAPVVNANPNAVLANPNPQAPLQTEDQLAQPDEMNVFQPAGGAAENPVPQIFRYGPIMLRPHADYQLMYGNGIQSTPGDQQETIIQEFSPGILMDLGSHWSLDYTPTFMFYSSDKFQDSVNHSIALTGDLLYEAWKFGLNHSTEITSAPMAETGEQTDQTTHSTTLSASRALNSQMSLDLGLNQTINLVSGFNNSYDWSTLDWLNYEFWPRLNAGIGAGGGYVLVQNNGQLGGIGGGDANQTYEQLQTRVNWRATQKLSFQLSVGLEDRQFMIAGAGSSLSPIFGATVEYMPFKGTQITLSGNRTVASSDYYSAALETETTIVSLNVDQRLFRQYKLGVGLAYSVTDYSTPSGLAAAGLANRTDDQVSFNARLSHPFFKRGTWALFYQYSDNTSSQAGFSYQSNQSGIEITYSF
jgi:hypothetical protein